jgi:hypothetical protein
LTGLLFPVLLDCFVLLLGVALILISFPILLFLGFLIYCVQPSSSSEEEIPLPVMAGSRVVLAALFRRRSL